MTDVQRCYEYIGLYIEGDADKADQYADYLSLNQETAGRMGIVDPNKEQEETPTTADA